jgi:hypothetical protein
MVSEVVGLELEPCATYSTVHNYSHLQKSIRWGLCSTDQWPERRSRGWHAIGLILEPYKRSPRLFLF